MSRQCLLFTCITLLVAVTLVASPAWAAAEKGSKKCNDGIDNDGDGLIDGDDPDCGGDGNGGGGAGKYSVDVTFRDFECDTSRPDRDHFCSDDGSPYEDGVDGVAAGGDKFRFSLTLQGTLRRFFLDFSDRDGNGEPDNCVSGPLTCDVTPSLDIGDTGLTSGGPENVFSTGAGESLLDMVEEETKLRTFQISFRDGEGAIWKLLFDPSQCNHTTLVPVTRTSGDTWDFIATDSEFACLQRRDNGPTTSHGRYRVPFKLTATLQP